MAFVQARADAERLNEPTHGGPLVVKERMGHEARIAADAPPHPTRPYSVNSRSPRIGGSPGGMPPKTM